MSTLFVPSSPPAHAAPLRKPCQKTTATTTATPRRFRPPPLTLLNAARRARSDDALRPHRRGAARGAHRLRRRAGTIRVVKDSAAAAPAPITAAIGSAEPAAARPPRSSG